MSAYFSHTVPKLILVTQGGIVLQILRILGVQFTETVTEVKMWQLSCLFICNLVNSITVDGMVSILLPYVIEFNIGNGRTYSVPNIVDSRCAVY